MARWPLSPTKVWDVWKDVTTASETPAEVVLTGGPELVEAARSRLARVGGQPRIWNGSPGGVADLQLGEGDILLVLVQPAQEDAWAEALKRRQPKAAVVVVDDGAAASYEITWYTPHVFRVSFADTPEGWRQVAEAMTDANDERMVAMARRYPALREAASHRVIQNTARQNAAIGVAFFLPGTDFPVMTLNQMKMVLMLGVIHGEELTKERAIELLGVLGAGFGLRAVARQGLAFVPGPGWALKGSVGYAGTRALGRAAVEYFTRGEEPSAGRLSGLGERVREGYPEVRGRISGLGKRLKR